MAVAPRLFPMRAGKPRALVNIKMREVSGVDHPATMMEGWMLMKAALPGGLSYRDLQERIKDELSESVPTLTTDDFWLEEVYGDHVVICIKGTKYVDFPYNLADDGTVTVTGGGTEVDRQTNWEADVEKFAAMVEDEEAMVKAHEVLGQLLLTVAADGAYLSDAPEDVRKAANTLFGWLQTEGFVGEDEIAKFEPSGGEPSQRRFLKVFSRLASMFKGVEEEDGGDALTDEQVMAGLQEGLPRLVAGVKFLKTAEATPAQKRAGIAFLINDLGATIQKHGKFKHDNSAHGKPGKKPQMSGANA